MKPRQKTCLAVAGFDPSGGAGIIADIKTFAAFGCRSTAAITSITFQNSDGVFGFVHQTPESICKQLEGIFNEFEVAAVKIGMVPTEELVTELTTILRAQNVKNIVIDPIIRSSSGVDLIDDQAIDAMLSELFPLATIVTPNIPEAERLTGIEIKNKGDISSAARHPHSLGVENVLIKGGHFETDSSTARDFLFTGHELTVLETQRIPNVSVRGTGCMLSSAIAANLAHGKELIEAVRVAKDFVREAIMTEKEFKIETHTSSAES